MKQTIRLVLLFVVFAIASKETDLMRKMDLINVQQGLVPGYSFVDKFGSNGEITTATDPEDVWGFGGEYIYDADSTAPIISLISTSALDTQEVEIVGLDSNGYQVTQTITLNGTTRVALDSNLWRVFRMQNEGTYNFAGTIYCYIGTETGGAPTGSNVRAIIDNGDNQTLMAVYTIPKGKVAFLYRGEVGIAYEGAGPSGIEYARFYYQSRRFGKVFKIKKEITLITGGTSLYQDERPAPDPIPAMTDIKIHVNEVSATMGAWATFDLLLVDENQFSDSYLQAIGQPGY